jgi:hypothetical protein
MLPLWQNFCQVVELALSGFWKLRVPVRYEERPFRKETSTAR